MIDDADVPLLFAFVIASAVVAAPSVDSILRMAGVAAVIGVVAHALAGAARALWRVARAGVRAPERVPEPTVSR